jgi:hypothetical protein
MRKAAFHNLRAAHASWLLAGGADIVVVQERLGHRRITATQQYTGTLADAGERALAAFRRIRHAQPPSQQRRLLFGLGRTHFPNPSRRTERPSPLEYAVIGPNVGFVVQRESPALPARSRPARHR